MFSSLLRERGIGRIFVLTGEGIFFKKTDAVKEVMKVNILVFVKQVADTEARIFIAGDGRSLDTENKYAMNFFDEFAVEAALRIKETHKESLVKVCTFGPGRAIEVLRTAVAMGADQAFLLDSTGLEADDTLIKAKILAGFARKEGFDLILCGRQAIDDENGSLGAMIAEFLDIPHASTVTKLEIGDDKRVLIESEVESGTTTIELDLPALLTVQKGLNEPRVPLITGVMKAMKTAVPIIDPASLDIDRTDFNNGVMTYVVSYEPPQSRPPVKIVEGDTADEKARNLVKLLKEEARAI
jgi:electron transfer flavoprotein beta subunit